MDRINSNITNHSEWCVRMREKKEYNKSKLGYLSIADEDRQSGERDRTAMRYHYEISFFFNKSSETVVFVVTVLRSATKK